MSNHPEGGWRNPTWRNLAIASIMCLVGIAVSVVAMVMLALR